MAPEMSTWPLLDGEGRDGVSDGRASPLHSRVLQDQRDADGLHVSELRRRAS